MELDYRAIPLVREIYRRMIEAGLNPFSLAAAVGRNQSYFRDIFRGKSQAPRAEYLPAIAKVLRCQVADLLHPGASGQTTEHEEEMNDYQADEIALVGFYRLLSADGKLRIMQDIIREAGLHCAKP